MKVVFFFIFSLFLALNASAQDQPTCKWEVPKSIAVSETSAPDYAVNISCSCPLKDVKVTVYNRWGSVIYSTNLLQHVWMGEDAESGFYMLQLEGVYKDGTPFSESANVYFMR